MLWFVVLPSVIEWTEIIDTWIQCSANKCGLVEQSWRPMATQSEHFGFITLKNNHGLSLFLLQAGEAAQTETVSEENKSLIWTLLKQVRPGMDLSKVVLPTFILEPRSFLDKLSDYYYHADFLSE